MQISELRSENASLRDSLIFLKNRVNPLESNIFFLFVVVSQLIYESAELEHCSTNLIRHDASESTYLHFVTKTSDNKKQFDFGSTAFSCFTSCLL